MTYKYVCKLWKGDTYQLEGADVVNLNDSQQYCYTFWHPKGGKKHLYTIPRDFRREALDMLYISMMVFYADRKIRRSVQDDAWTRHIELHLPVLCLQKWDDNKETLTRALNFLTGDKWTLQFRNRSALTDEESHYKRAKHFYRNSVNSIDTDTFCMLSGGLDSFIGAINLLTMGKRPIFVGNYNGGKGVSIYQNQVIRSLSSHFGISADYFFQFFAAPRVGIEDSTRSRSILFFAHAIILASGMGHHIELCIPENGVISLNIPLTVHRLGSLSTRTTHPYFISLLQRLLDGLDLDIKLTNPFQFQTKGEMMVNCLDRQYLDSNYHLTMSCSHPDQGRFKRDPKPSHCGVCLPCTIRRAAILKAGLVDSSSYRDPFYRTPDASLNLKSYRLGLAEPNYPLSAIQMSGPITGDRDAYADLYQRGLKEQQDFIDTIK